MTLTPSRGTLITRRIVHTPRPAAEALFTQQFNQLSPESQLRMITLGARRAIPSMAHLSDAELRRFYEACLTFIADDWTARERDFKKWVTENGGNPHLAMALVEQLGKATAVDRLNAKGRARDDSPHARPEHQRSARDQAFVDDEAHRRAAIEAAVRKHNPGYLSRPVTAAEQGSEREKEIVAAIDQLQGGISRIVEDRTDLRGGVDMRNDIREAMEQLGTDFGDSHEVAHFTERAE